MILVSMFSFGISLFILIIVGAILGSMGVGEAFEKGKMNKLAGIIGLILVVLGLAGVCGIACGSVECDGEENLVQTTNLYALGSGTGVHGKFIWGSGTVDDVQYYIGYTDIGDKQYKQIKFDASKSVLVLDDNETPRVETYTVKTFKNVFDIFLMEDEILPMYKIYIPVDGIDNEYKVS